MSNGIATAFILAGLIAPSLQAQVAAPDAPLAPQARYLVDSVRNRAWSLSPEGVLLVELSKPGKAAISLPEWVWAREPYGCLPDLAVGPRGEAVITSNVVPTLWRIDPDTLAVSVHRLALDADNDKDIGFSALVYSREHDAFFAASTSHGSLWRIDPRLVTGQKIPLSASMPDPQPNTGKPAGLCK